MNLKIAILQPELRSALRVLLLYLKSGILQPELRERSSRTTFCTWKLRTSSRTCGALRASFVRKRCLRSRRCGRARRTSHGATARALRHALSPQPFSELKTHSHGATARALRHARSPQRVRRAQDTFARRHSESASTRTISAEGSPSSGQIRTAPQRERFHTHDLRRGFAELKTNSHGATARALRHARSPQRVRRAQAKFARRHSESETNSHGATARALRHARSPQRVRRVQDTFVRRHSESASTRRISAERSPSSRHIRTAPQRESPSSRQIRMAPQRERFDTHDLPRGFAELKPNSHGATARALRHARSPQRARRAQDKFARRHSESASTRTISAEGSPSARHIRAAPQRERFDTHDLCRRFAELETHSHRATARVAELKTHSHGATARALRRAQSPQSVRRAQDKFARRHSESASTRTISAEGSPSARHIRAAPRSPQRVRRDRDTFAPRHSESRRAQDKFARRHSESASTRTISAEGSPSSSQIRTAPQRERFDTHDLRRGFAECKTHSRGATARALRPHGATARALRHAQSPQRVRRAQDKFARRHSESASTRTISAEGSPSSRQVRTAPQRERFDTHDLRKGFTFVLQRLQMSETLRLPRNSQTLFPKMLRLPRIICISAKRAAPTTKNARQSHRMLRWPWNSAATRKSEDRRGATARAQF